MGVVWLCVAVLLGVLAVLMPRAESGESTLALRRFLAGSGVEVSEEGSPPPAGTFLLLHDLRTREEARSLLEWAAGGGHLVVADPASAVVGLAGAEAGEPLGLVGAQAREPACLAEEVVGIRRIAARASDRALRGDPFVSCFGGLAMVRAHGEGSVVLLGGFTAFTNEYLRSADNALFALRVLGRGPEVTFGSPIAPQGGAPTMGVWEALPERARAMIAAIVVAAVVFAAVRGRRLGTPSPEEPIAPIPASELVRATSHLYRRGRSLGHAARVMRASTRGRIGRRFGVEAGRDELPAIAAHATGMPPERVEEALAGPEPRTDEDLIRLGSLLAEVETRARGGPS
ncbi:MAG TPA: DUF4350 domain-containing protein [Actinomycetota bacterium]|nr:DUF4350 domain-containing protein [Actinomycetota bacterium]